MSSECGHWAIAAMSQLVREQPSCPWARSNAMGARVQGALLVPLIKISNGRLHRGLS